MTSVVKWSSRDKFPSWFSKCWRQGCVRRVSDDPSHIGLCDWHARQMRGW